jgi:Icc-related predicted phosphoesterase
MRILAFVDSHGNKRAMEALEREARTADLLVCAGDVSVFEQDLDKILRKIDSWGKPVLMLHGNHESEADMVKACKGLQNVEFFHKKAKIINNILFIGYGGGGFEKKTPELADFFKSHEILLNSCEKKVFLFHAPPLDTKLDLIGSSHNGNQTEKELILRYKPGLVVCGHFHENADKRERTEGGVLINPGPAGWLIEL